ncbi:hypothetical protein CY35_08G136200 [Sphagnum magellanicum]|nr:hypothetical protein CY35_08G136200 [Sphagnum magellanicum]
MVEKQSNRHPMCELQPPGYKIMAVCLTHQQWMSQLALWACWPNYMSH